MKSVSVNRDKTYFNSPFIQDYYTSDKFDELRSFKPDVSEIKNVIAARRSFSAEKRELLVHDLKRQYAETSLEIAGSVVEQNINRLSDENTFTITTGQQIHIGLGPLYVLYKTFDVMALCKSLAQEYTSYCFVPVFWMASEDHDLEEIQEIPLFGKTYRWETEQEGAVGRMTTEGLPALFQKIKEENNLDENQAEFVGQCIAAYSSANNLSEAFRIVMHHYFGDSGLVIIDADSPRLKESFGEVIADELQQKNYDALSASTQLFESQGYKKQLVVRKTNLFKLEDGKRTRVQDGNSQTSSALSPYTYSPNAALRPFYQEWILPNLVYIGGQAELKYWMQLKGVFDNYLMKMPLVMLRTSAVIIPERVQSKFPTIDWTLMFASEHEIVKVLDVKNEEVHNRLEDAYGKIEDAIHSYNAMVSAEILGFTLDSKLRKLQPKLVDLKTVVDSNWVKKVSNDPELKRILKVKDRYFGESIQERTEHVIGYCSLLEQNLKGKTIGFGNLEEQKITMIFI